jgi:aerobic carbon-monoxide dehydrogenase small subunit
MRNRPVKRENVRLRVNGCNYQLQAEPNLLLLDALRQHLGLTGTKRGCDDSSCGACTVLVDGEPQMSCLMLAVSCQEIEVTTIEGVAASGEGSATLDPLQLGFALEGGAQCGFCTPGMILTAKHLLTQNPEPTDQQIKEALSGNLCRCTGYTQIVASVRRAVDLLRQANANDLQHIAGASRDK